MVRFVEADESVVEVYIKAMEQRFPSLAQLKIKLIFDTKRRINQGKIALAMVELANDKIKFFSKDKIAVGGYDIIIIFDMKAWELSDDKNRMRIMSHELRHILIDEKGKLKLIPHDISDFREEQRLNIDDPDWGLKLSTLVNDIYEQEKEMVKPKKGE